MAFDTQILLAGEQGLMVVLGDRIDPEINARVIGLHQSISEERPVGLIEAIPSYCSLLVLYDPLLTTMEKMERTIHRVLETLKIGEIMDGQQVVVPTVYGGEYGPDLDDVASHSGLSAAEVIQIHSNQDYRVYMLGFTPGFPYLGGLDSRIATPRLVSPRTQIPAGSVGIAGQQTGVYPLASPGGWRLIGRTPVRLFEPQRDPPALIQPGDRVRFESVSPEQYERLAATSGVADDSQAVNINAHPVCRILLPGLMTTIQDLGRWGYQDLGVPTAGAMDARALRLVNILLGNLENDAALEITLLGPEIEFLADACVSVGGADLGAILDDQPMPMWSAIPVKAGSRLSFKGRIRGCRSYLAISGGFCVPKIMGSSATYIKGNWGGYQGRALQAGDLLQVGAPSISEGGRSVPQSLTRYIFDSNPLPVMLGPQKDYFTSEALDLFLQSEYTISSQSDRMGTRLEGPVLSHRAGADIISDGIPPGAVQVPGHGCPIVMTADRQTTGGYPKIAVLTRRGLDRLAQKMPGENLAFQAITFEEATDAYHKDEKEIRSWAASLNRTDNKKTWRLIVNGTAYEVTVRPEDG